MSILTKKIISDQIRFYEEENIERRSKSMVRCVGERFLDVTIQPHPTPGGGGGGGAEANSKNVQLR